MSRKYTVASGNMDSTKLPEAVNAALDRYYERYAQGLTDFKVKDVVMAYGGDRQARNQLAQDLAQATGTKYKSQQENIRRWMNAESGRGGQTRTPKKQLSILKNLFSKKSAPPPSGGTGSINGKIASKSPGRGRTVDARDRDIDLENGSGPMDVEGLIDAVQREDMNDAYEAFFAGYSSNLYAEEAYNINIDFY